MRARPLNASRCLLACPGWRDAGHAPYDHLQAALQPLGWTCRRANLPDAQWPAAARARVSPAQALALATADFDALDALDAQAAARSCVRAVVGASFGAYIAAHLTGVRNIDLLVLRSPALYPDDAWLQAKESGDVHALRRFRERIHTPAEVGVLAFCSLFRGHVLLVCSENDEVMPPPVIESYRRAFQHARSLQQVTLKSADHELSDPASQDAYRWEVTQWLIDRML